IDGSRPSTRAPAIGRELGRRKRRDRCVRRRTTGRSGWRSGAPSTRRRRSGGGGWRPTRWALSPWSAGGLGACRRTLGAGEEAAGDEHADLPGDATDIDRAPIVERLEDDLLDAAHDELGDDLGIERPQYAESDVRADVRRDDSDDMLIDLGQRLAHEAGAVSHTKDQARRIAIREHDLHDLPASRLDEGDVLLLPPHHVRGEIERRPMLDGVEDATYDAIHECGQDVALVREVLVQGAPRDERPPTDVGDGRLMEAFAREHRERTVEDLLPALVARQIRSAAPPRNRHAALGTPLMSCVQRTCTGRSGI